MKYIKLETIEDYSYKTNLMQMVENTSPPTGLDLPAIKKSLKIIDTIEKTQDGQYLKLEDADYEHLKMLVNNMRFVKVHRPTVQMLEAVLNAPDSEPVESASECDS